MKLYKLTDQNFCTYNNTKWGIDVTHTASGKGELCSKGWLHAYSHPLIAAFMNPIHGNFEDPILWIAEGEPKTFNGALKLGTSSLTTKRQIEFPNLSLEFRVRVAIKIALSVYKAPAFVKWALDWLSDKDRTTARATRVAREIAAWAALGPVRGAALGAVSAAAEAAKAAEWAALGAVEWAELGAEKPVSLLSVLCEVAAELNVKWEE